MNFPGVYIEEVSFRAHSIEGVSTTKAAFIGFAETAPAGPALVTSFAEYLSQFGGAVNGYLAYAVQGFFQNGGTRCFILGIPDSSVDCAATLAQLANLSDISMVCCPDEHAIPGMTAALVTHCELMRYRIAVLGAPQGSYPSDIQEARSSYVAYYAPWLLVANPAGGAPIAVHPGGHVAGAIARNDVERGVFKAPANIALQGILGLEREISKQEQTVLNPRGVNVIRNFPGRGSLIWGARTTSPDQDWKYVNVRRLLNYLEHSIDEGTQWAVFEPNGEQLWGNVRQAIEDFLFNVWVSGALLGNKANEAYFVRCDRTTMTQNDIDNGRLICLVGVAALRPAEFIGFEIVRQVVR
jgi:phage tail sheath protein FI